MIGIVEANPDELAHTGYAGPKPYARLNQRKLVDVELAQSAQARWCECQRCKIGDMVRKIANTAVRPDYAGPLDTFISVSDEFHVTELGMRSTQRQAGQQGLEDFEKSSLGVSGISCLRHIMTTRSRRYAEKTEAARQGGYYP